MNSVVIPAGGATGGAQAPPVPARLRFARRSAFQRAVRQAVAAHFRARGVAPNGDRRLHIKATLLVGWWLTSYLALVFGARTWWQAVPLALSLGFAATAVGFNIHHDSNHGAFARSYRANRALGFVLDLLGGSSYVWRWKHNHFHHNFTNVAGHDADIDGAPLIRMTAQQPRRFIHRYQHIYCWFAYTLFPIRWWFWDDYQDLAGGTIAGHPFSRPRGWEAAAVIAGKLAFLVWALVIPLWRHPVAAVAGCYAIGFCVLGVCLALSAQLSHCVDETEFPTPAAGAAGAQVDVEWAVHQIRTCSGFSHGSRIANWFWGGLNFQVEHHLFPRVSHVHYPAIAPIVEATCRRFGLRYRAHATFWQAIRSHARMMRRLGRA